jgi:K+-transporting ATPase ATPase C chain
MSKTPISTDVLPLHDGGAWRASLVLAPVILLGFGLLYSLASTGITGMLFPHQSTGSLVERNGVVIGSALVAQPFAAAGYFQPRPSAAKYDPTAAAASNQARSNPELIQRIADTRKAVAARDGIAEADVADDLLTQSGSGLDPHISVAAARQQVTRVAQARGWPEARVSALVDSAIEPPQFGVLGQPRVNVLKLNLALDAQASGA